MVWCARDFADAVVRLYAMVRSLAFGMLHAPSRSSAPQARQAGLMAGLGVGPCCTDYGTYGIDEQEHP